MLPSESIASRRCWYVYALCEPETLEVRYIGKTLDLAARLRAHCSDNNSVAPLVKSWIGELGMSPVIVELASFCDEQSALDREGELIAEFTGPRLLNRRRTGSIDEQPGGFAGFSERVRAGRESLGVSQKSLAKAIGMHGSRLSRVENGRCDNISLTTAVRLARALGTTVEYLVTGERPTRTTDTSVSAHASAAGDRVHGSCSSFAGVSS